MIEELKANGWNASEKQRASSRFMFHIILSLCGTVSAWQVKNVQQHDFFRVWARHNFKSIRFHFFFFNLILNARARYPNSFSKKGKQKAATILLLSRSEIVSKHINEDNAVPNCFSLSQCCCFGKRILFIFWVFITVFVGAAFAPFHGKCAPSLLHRWLKVFSFHCS